MLLKGVKSVRSAYKYWYTLEDKIVQCWKMGQRENKGKMVKMESDLRLVHKMGATKSC